MKGYILVLVALLIGTVVTVVTGKMDLGSFNLVIALVIATTKATLVVLYFMHLKDSTGLNRLVFVVSILFALVLITGVFGDIMTRNPVSLPHGGPVPRTGTHSGAMHLPAAHH